MDFLELIFLMVFPHFSKAQVAVIVENEVVEFDHILLIRYICIILQHITIAYIIMLTHIGLISDIYMR